MQSMAAGSAAAGVVMFGGAGDHMLNDLSTFENRTVPCAGNFISRVVDTGGAAYFGALSWDADVPQNASVRFQFRAAGPGWDISETPFSGPDGTAGTYYETSGGRIASFHNGSQSFQYRALLYTSDARSMPVG